MASYGLDTVAMLAGLRGTVELIPIDDKLEALILGSAGTIEILDGSFVVSFLPDLAPFLPFLPCLDILEDFNTL